MWLADEEILSGLGSRSAGRISEALSAIEERMADFDRPRLADLSLSIYDGCDGEPTFADQRRLFYLLTTYPFLSMPRPHRWREVARLALRWGDRQVLFAAVMEACVGRSPEAEIRWMVEAFLAEHERDPCEKGRAVLAILVENLRDVRGDQGELARRILEELGDRLQGRNGLARE
jgi:hypothetical protein